MALNIPNVGSNADALIQGFDTGSTMFSRLMQPILEREKQKQAAEQFQQELALKKQQEARLGANSDLNRQILQQQLLGLQHENDPNYEFKQYKALQDFITNGGLGGSNPAVGGQQPVVGTSMPNNVPTKPFGEGMGVYTPQELQTMQTLQQSAATKANINNPQSSNGANVNMDLLKQNPLLRGFFKKKFGFDPIENETTYQGVAREAYDLQRLKDTYGENSEVYKNAKTQYDASIDAKKDLADLRARTKAGLKPGEKEFFDPDTGVPLGKEVPYTEKERESEEGNIFFNEVYPYVYKGGSPFSGQGSITRLQQVAQNYNTDPRAKKMFDDFLLSNKLLAATTVNEASTLKTRGTNATYQMLKESLDAQDIPKLVTKFIKEYNIPASAQLNAAIRYQKVLSDSRNKARKNVPATQKLFYDPKMQEQYEAQNNGTTATTATTGKVIVIDPNNKRYETTEANAANLPEGWKRG